MRRSIYRELTTYLLVDCRAAIAKFGRSPQNEQVFAFALECDPLRGEIVLGFNTEPGLKQVLASKYPNAKADEIRGLDGIRYRCRDFAYVDFGFSRDTHGLLNEIATILDGARTEKTTERHAESLLATVSRVVLMLERDFAALNCADPFIAYVTRTGATESARVALMRRTVSEPAFDLVFPEFRAFEERLRQVDSLPSAERASFWVTSARDLALERRTPEAERFRSGGISIDSMMDHAVQIGSVAVAPLLEVLEETAMAPQLLKSGTKKQCAPTMECAFSMRIMQVLREIRLVDGHSIDRLTALQSDIAKGKNSQGPLSHELSVLLHELRPALFARPKSERPSCA